MMSLAIMKATWLGTFIIVSSLVQIHAACNRRPQGANGDRSPVDQNFQILIDGNPSTYIPGQQYNVSLSCPINMKFVSFTIALESENAIGTPTFDITGNFKIVDTTDSRFSAECENMIESTNTNAKTRIEIAWIAPTNPDSGCVLIRAGVLQHRDVWFIDDGLLTKRICPEEIDEINSLTRPVDPCCACDEAKYEITLERKWARNTHAKDFPIEASRTRFSEIVGASHTYDYRFWQYGSSASRGLEELAEHGATFTLEQEIKENVNNGNIRTIIKAPGISYRPNVMGTTLANARVDAKHHLISLVTKIEPSPDWILGIAGLELCLNNCTWIERKILNLYPWDAGTDAGPSYMSADQEQLPPDVIRRITSSFPSDYRSPFFDESGAPMKPLATLYITRKKLYIRECEAVENEPLECATHPWNNWSECSTRCGPGKQYRVRFYKNAALAESYSCDLELRDERICMGEQCGVATEDRLDQNSGAECELTLWSQWSLCSKSCGKGNSKRTRDYRNPHARERCQEGVYVELEQSKDCIGTECGGNIPGTFNAANGELDDNDETVEQFGEPEPDFGEAPTQSWNQYGGSLSKYRNRNEQTTEYNVPYGPTRRQGNRFHQNFGSNRQQRPSYKNDDELENNGQEDEYVPYNNIYGSEKLIGYANRPENQDNKYSARYPMNPGNYLSNYPKDQQQQQNSRTPIGLSGFNGKSSSRPLPRMDTSGIRESYDDEGRKIVLAQGSDSSNYKVVQEYCLQKPFVSRHPCYAKIVENKNYWFYDAEDRECKLFTTDNCDENKNKFRTLEVCEGICLNPHKNQEEAEDSGIPSFAGGNMNGRSDGRDFGFGEPQSQIRERINKNKPRYNRYRH